MELNFSKMEKEDLINKIKRNFFKSKEDCERLYLLDDVRGVIDSIPMRNLEDVAIFIPHIMIDALNVDDWSIFSDEIESLFYMLDGFCLEGNFDKFSEKLASIINIGQAECIHDWLSFIFKNREFDIAKEEIESGILYWNRISHANG